MNIKQAIQAIKDLKKIISKNSDHIVKDRIEIAISQIRQEAFIQCKDSEVNSVKKA